MRITRKLVRGIAVAAIATLGLGLAACSSGDASTEAGEGNPYNLITPGEIRVASVGDIRPYTFTGSDGKFTGFGVELFREVADRMGIEKVVFTGQDFSALLAAVANGQYDVGVAAIGITDERKETVDFSDGYLAGYLTIMTREGAGIDSQDELAGHRVGVVQGTLQETYAIEHFTESKLVKFPDNNTAVAALNSGTIDAHFLDFESAKLYFEQYDDLVKVENIPSFDAPAGFAVAKNNDALEKALNKALHEVMEDGTWKELHEKWFEGTPMPDRYLPSGEGSTESTPASEGSK